MKKYILGLTIGSVFILGACSSEDTEPMASEVSDSNLVTESNFMDNVQYEVPVSWEKEVAHEHMKYYYPEDGMLMVSFEEIRGDVLDAERQKEFLDGWLDEAEDAELLTKSEIMINDNRVFTFQTRQIFSGERYNVRTVLMNTSNGFITLGMVTSINYDNDYTDDFDRILNSIVISESEIPDEEKVSTIPEASEDTILTESNYMISIEYEVPEEWEKEVTQENIKSYYSDASMLRVHFTDDKIDLTDSESRETFLELYFSDIESYEVLSESEITINGKDAYSFDFKQTTSDYEFESTLVLFNDSKGLFVFHMMIFDENNGYYRDSFENILNSIVYSDSPTSNGSTATTGNETEEFYFDGTNLVKEDYTITITDYKVLKPGEQGNEYDSDPVIAFWYDITVSEEATSTEYNPTMPWMFTFEAIQDNNDNFVNKLNMTTLSGSDYLNTQFVTIKPGGTVSHAVAYKLTDLETPVTLNAVGNLITNEQLGRFDYNIR